MAVDPTLKIGKSLINPQGWNRYAYAANNPLKYVDPDGRLISNMLQDVPKAEKHVNELIAMDPRLAAIHLNTKFKVTISTSDLYLMPGGDEGGVSHFLYDPATGEIWVMVLIDPKIAGDRLMEIIESELARLIQIRNDPQGMTDEYNRQIQSTDPNLHFRPKENRKIADELADYMKASAKRCEEIQCREDKEEEEEESE